MRQTMRSILTASATLLPPCAASGQTCVTGWFNPTTPFVISDVVFDMIEFDLDGAGPQPMRLVAGGGFPLQPPSAGIKYWGGAGWLPVGSSLDGAVYALASHDDDGPGPGAAALYAGGSFVTGGGQPLARLARWNGIQWTAVAGGFPASGSSVVQALLSMPDGVPGAPGPALVAGGFLTVAGTTPVSHIAALSAGAWSNIGGGLNQQVRALAEFDPDGAGPLPRCLYAGGHFTAAGGAPAMGLARWDGNTWSVLGTGVTGLVTSLTVLDLGGGPRLLVGGQFASAGGLPSRNIAAWDGSAWSGFGTGIGTDGGVNDAAMFDADGPGPAPSELHITGYYLGVTAPTTFLGFAARWNGTSWQRVGTHVITSGVTQGETLLAVEAGRTYPAGLYFGGRIPNTLPFSAASLAAYGCLPCYADCNRDAVLNLSDFGCFQSKFATADPYADCNSDGARNLADFGCFQTSFALGCP